MTFVHKPQASLAVWEHGFVCDLHTSRHTWLSSLSVLSFAKVCGISSSPCASRVSAASAESGPAFVTVHVSSFLIKRLRADPGSFVSPDSTPSRPLIFTSSLKGAPEVVVSVPWPACTLRGRVRGANTWTRQIQTSQVWTWISESSKLFSLQLSTFPGSRDPKSRL